MSLLTEASLVILPNAVEEGKLFSIIPADGSGDMTAVRATTATLVNSEGVIEDCPYNLVSYSEKFDNASWSKTAGVVVTSNSETSPDGTLTADTINFGASNRIVSQATTLATGVVTTGSIYVKGISGQTIQLAVGGVDVLFTLNGNWQKLEATRTSVTSIFNLNTFGGATARIISVWGAQLVTGTEPKEYFPTTDRLNVPRLDYTNGSCPSILVEPQRTNLALNSQSFIPAWSTSSQTNATITSTNTIDPEGLTNAVRITNVSGTTMGRLFTVVPGTTYTSSIWVRRVNGVGNVEFVDLNGTSAILNLTTEWKRFSITCTAVSIGRFYIRVNTVGDSIEVWGAQLEAGSNATSYIPTVASTVTRNADVISKSGISSLINSQEGVLFCEISALSNDITDRLISLTNGTSTERISIYYSSNASNEIKAIIFVGSAIQCNFSYTGSDITNMAKIALKYKQNDFSLFVNGIKRATNNSGITFPANKLNKLSFDLGLPTITLPFNGNVKKIAVFPTALSDVELSQLTTL